MDARSPPARPGVDLQPASGRLSMLEQLTFLKVSVLLNIINTVHSLIHSSNPYIPIKRSSSSCCVYRNKQCVCFVSSFGHLCLNLSVTAIKTGWHVTWSHSHLNGLNIYQHWPADGGLSWKQPKLFEWFWLAAPAHVHCTSTARGLAVMLFLCHCQGFCVSFPSWTNTWLNCKSRSDVCRLCASLKCCSEFPLDFFAFCL